MVSENHKPGHNIIVIGASAGGVQTLMELCRGFPVTLAASVFVVVHTSPTSPGVLPQILDRAGPLPVTFPMSGETFRAGRVYVAPPDHHMLLTDNTILLTRGPKENGFRPAVDPLFRTAAREHGGSVIGVVLSGGLDDGSEGAVFIKVHGGLVVVQDPAEAACPSMPESALEVVEADYVVGVREMPGLLARLAEEPASNGETVMRKKLKDIGESAYEPEDALKTHELPGPPSPLTCPECGGTLWELHESGKLVRYRCHVGHNYTSKGLMATKGAELESALWSAFRALEENAELRRRMARRAEEGNLTGLVEHYQKAAEEAEERAEVLRRLLAENRNGNGDPEETRTPGGQKVRLSTIRRAEKKSRKPQGSGARKRGQV